MSYFEINISCINCIPYIVPPPWDWTIYSKICKCFSKYILLNYHQGKLIDISMKKKFQVQPSLGNTRWNKFKQINLFKDYSKSYFFLVTFQPPFLGLLLLKIYFGGLRENHIVAMSSCTQERFSRIMAKVKCVWMFVFALIMRKDKVRARVMN